MQRKDVRIDDKTYAIIEKNAANQGIKISRYIRSLIEKGLVIDSQINRGDVPQNPLNADQELFNQLVEISIENTILTRKMLRNFVETEEDYNNILRSARERAMTYTDAHFRKNISDRNS